MRKRLGYLSGSKLVRAHNESVFQVVDQNSGENVGNIAILRMEPYKEKTA